VEFVAKAGSGGNSGVLYEFAGRANDDSVDPPPFPPYTGNAVLGSNARSGGENQKLLPKLLVNGVNISPTTDSVRFTDAVSFEPTKAFALRGCMKSIESNFCASRLQKLWLENSIPLT
jgi:hypothetical protein